jgi:hypothetical protein
VAIWVTALLLPYALRDRGSVADDPGAAPASERLSEAAAAVD